MELSTIETKQAAIESVKSYFAAHPGSPSAVQRPLLFRYGKVWTASLVPNLREGIAGFGPTVDAALRDFDAQYLCVLRSPKFPAQIKGLNKNKAITAL